MSPAAAPGAGCRPRHQARSRAHPAAGAQGHRAHRPPSAPMISMTPKDEVWSLGKATLWRYRRPEARHRAAGHAVPRSRRRLGHLRSPPRHLLGREAARRGLRRLPLRLGQARGRRGRPHPRHVPRWLLHPRRRRRAPHRGGRRGRAWAPTAWGRSCSCCCSAAATTFRRPSIVLFTPPCDFEHAPAFIEQLPRGTAAARGRHRRDDRPRAGGRHPRHVPPAPADVRSSCST